MFDFDKEIKRKGTNCSKWDHQGGDFIPMWVADMEFAVAPEIVDSSPPKSPFSLHRKQDHASD